MPVDEAYWVDAECEYCGKPALMRAHECRFDPEIGTCWCDSYVVCCDECAGTADNDKETS